MIIFKGKLTIMPIRLKVSDEYVDFNGKRCVLLIDSTNHNERDDESTIFIVKVLEPVVATTTLNFTLSAEETDTLAVGNQYNWRLKVEGDAIPTRTQLQPLSIQK